MYDRWLFIDTLYMSETQPAKKSGKRRVAIWVAAVVVIGLVVAGLTAPMVIRSHKDPLLGEFYRLKNYGIILSDFAASNDGRLPKDLQELAAYSAKSQSGSITRYHSPKTGVSADWLYFPGFASKDRPDTIVMASPATITKADETMYVEDGICRMILALDGRTAFLNETDYQKCLAEQVLDSWRNTDLSEPQFPWKFLSNPVWAHPEVPLPPAAPSAAKIRKQLIALKTGDGIERWNAADELAKMGPVSPEIVPSLLEALGDSEAGYLSAMGLATMSLKDDSILPSLVQAMKSKNAKEEYWAAVAIEEIGLVRVNDAIPLMAAALSRTGDDITVTAAKALAGAGPVAVSAVPQLLQVATGNDVWAKKCAIIALGRIGPQAREAIPKLVAMFHGETNFKIDVARAIWKIDPSQGVKIVAFLTDIIKSQRDKGGPNRTMDNNFFSALELLAEIGPAAIGAVPVLKSNLQGGARISSAWALVQIDPSLKESLTLVLADSLNPVHTVDDRIQRLATGRKGIISSVGQSTGVYPSDGLEACGMLWQIYPDRRDDLIPVIVALLCEWQKVRGLSAPSPDLRHAIPALEGLLENRSLPEEVQMIAMEALQNFRTLDPGNW